MGLEWADTYSGWRRERVGEWPVTALRCGRYAPYTFDRCPEPAVVRLIDPERPQEPHEVACERCLTALVLAMKTDKQIVIQKLPK